MTSQKTCLLSITTALVLSACGGGSSTDGSQLSDEKQIDSLTDETEVIVAPVSAATLFFEPTVDDQSLTIATSLENTDTLTSEADSSSAAPASVTSSETDFTPLESAVVTSTSNASASTTDTPTIDTPNTDATIAATPITDTTITNASIAFIPIAASPLTSAVDSVDPIELTHNDIARYRVTLENFWGEDDFPQGFPEEAHLSLVGGATHNVAVSFWNVGEVASKGIEDMAEAGLIDRLLLDEVGPAITNGTANSTIEFREYTDAKIGELPGRQVFEIEMNIEWPLVSLVTMLGPSPDWFVGVSGLSLLDNGEWTTELSVDLPLYDGGSKSDITPIMGGPDIIPPNPIGLVAYDKATGVYLATDEPQNVARLTFEKL